ncbi:hypothetical protein F2Q65_12550 [Thiohalocapsa marina]|uniref:Uncharacterized protein n=1 Tax=Thiohalocapsa marina TaxID=424902 RepID=A0A5M8FMM3_9GAMM|nr:hypothetical protein [Thiohalocapsa marina]KAA6184401.1 hypothetical protein F2Q65_12550 [Thiohalocapsa marina]
MYTNENAHLARLVISGPFGIVKYTVRIVWKFLWFYRIEATRPTQLPGRRVLMPGERAWVPKRGVQRVVQAEPRSKP